MFIQRNFQEKLKFQNNFFYQNSTKIFRNLPKLSEFNKTSKKLYDNFQNNFQKLNEDF